MTELRPYEAARNRLLMALVIRRAGRHPRLDRRRGAVHQRSSAPTERRRWRCSDDSIATIASHTLQARFADGAAHSGSCWPSRPGSGSAASEVQQKDRPTRWSPTPAPGWACDRQTDLRPRATMIGGQSRARRPRGHGRRWRHRCLVWPQMPSRSVVTWHEWRSPLRQANTRSSVHRPRCAGR